MQWESGQSALDASAGCLDTPQECRLPQALRFCLPAVPGKSLHCMNPEAQVLVKPCIDCCHTQNRCWMLDHGVFLQAHPSYAVPTSGPLPAPFS